MNTLIAIVTGVLVIGSAMLQLVLVIIGFRVLGQVILPFLPGFEHEGGQFRFWGGWHLFVILLMTHVIRDEVSVALEAYQSVQFQEEGILILALFLVLPLIASFLISRGHYLFYKNHRRA